MLSSQQGGKLIVSPVGVALLPLIVPLVGVALLPLVVPLIGPHIFRRQAL